MPLYDVKRRENYAIERPGHKKFDGQCFPTFYYNVDGSLMELVHKRPVKTTW
jgi:hypothetical protein